MSEWIPADLAHGGPAASLDTKLAQMRNANVQGLSLAGDCPC
jgi:hypothetical protein